MNFMLLNVGEYHLFNAITDALAYELDLIFIFNTIANIFSPFLPIMISSLYSNSFLY